MWADMSDEQRRQTLRNMFVHGDLFAALLVHAWKVADKTDAQKLADAFPDLVARYAAMGPAK
jgi:hypothetical protein